jgi:Ca2+:H+ antiporter
MLSNLLLVMGMCFFFGGIGRDQQHFNMTVAQTAASLLALAIASLVIPTAFNNWANLSTTTSDDQKVASLNAEFSRGTAILLLLVYGCYLFFQLRTHVDIYNEPSKKSPKKKHLKKLKGKKHSDANNAAMQTGANLPAPDAQNQIDEETNNDQEDKEEPQLSMLTSIITLCVSTALVGVCAEFMVDAIGDVVNTTNVSRTFIGLILLPIVGNAAEHATAVTVACKDKMDLAIGVAIGSSMQIALLVLPLVVTIGWIAGKEDMTLVFDPFEIIILFVSVLLGKFKYLISFDFS